MKFFNTSLLLLATSVLSTYAITLDAGTPMKAVSGSQPTNTTQVMPSHNASAVEHPDSIPKGGYSPIGPGPVPDPAPNDINKVLFTMILRCSTTKSLC